MTTDAGKTKAETAKAAHERAAYDEAADAYAAAASEYLGANGLEHAVSAATGLRYLLTGAACLRHRGRRERCRRYCRQGDAISEEIGDRAQSLPPEPHAYDQSVRGVWFEFAGDFRTVGDLPDADAAYDRAAEAYADAGDPETASFEQFHLAAAVLPKLLVRGTGADSDDLEAVLRPGATLTEWVAFKRRRLPDLLERLDDCDEWTYVF